MEKKFARKLFISLFVLIILNLSLFADTSYKVEKGDTLYSISRKYQITVAELRTANNLSENDVIKVGQKLIIPDADIGTAAALSSTKNSASSAPAGKTVEYVVAKGDTLYGIARKNGMTVADLMSINNLDSSAVIKVGQKLKVSAGGSSTSSSSSTAKTSEPAKSGETVIKVNEKAPDTRTYGTTVTADANTKWPVSSPKITQVKGKISGVQLSAKTNEAVLCIHEGTVMYVGTYRGFGQVLFVQTKTGLIYAYTGMGTVKVKKGDYAMSGAEVGTAGVDPISGKPQITFMVFQNGQPIDPAKAPRN
jgi:LysM repeat protein